MGCQRKELYVIDCSPGGQKQQRIQHTYYIYIF